MTDCGIIPYLLYKNHGFRAVMVGGGNFVPEKFPYLEKYVRGLEMDFFGENTLSDQISYIDAHADDMDLGADMNIIWASKAPFGEPAYKKFFQACDVVATSCRAVQKYISVKWNVPVHMIRNGRHNFAGVTFDNLFERKENIILTVARLGTAQKRNDIMLEAFAKVAAELPDWKLRLVGNTRESFKPYIEKYFATHPDLKDRVTFTGLIEDKTELMEEFKRTKIFCLTSTFEGAPNVAAEFFQSATLTRLLKFSAKSAVMKICLQQAVVEPLNMPKEILTPNTSLPRCIICFTEGTRNELP